MKYFFLLFFSLSAIADISLDDAYKREKAFLTAQKESLLKMKSHLLSSQNNRKALAEKDIAKKESELSRLLLKNQELHEEYKVIEKMTKESSQMEGQLEKNQLKIQDHLNQIRAKLGVGHSPSTETDVVKKFEATLESGLELLTTISSESWRPHAFLDENDQLVQGEVLFQGLFSAWGKHGSKIFSLVPYNNEFLKVMSDANKGDVYLFSPDFARTGLKVSKSWKESVADAIPGIVMAFIMLAVLGLFILLARA
ncbi:MAG: hypothetical protein ACLGHN_14000 [Bacteriovoracia bacterium]